MVLWQQSHRYYRACWLKNTVWCVYKQWQQLWVGLLLSIPVFSLSLSCHIHVGQCLGDSSQRLSTALLLLLPIFWVEIVFSTSYFLWTPLSHPKQGRNKSHMCDMSLGFHQTTLFNTLRDQIMYTSHKTQHSPLRGEKEKTGRWGKEMNRRKKGTFFFP